MADLSDDERMLLTALAVAKEPTIQSAVLDQLLPPFPTLWPRKAGKRRWLARWDDVTAAWSRLEQQGFLTRLATDSTRYVITAAGREALDGARKPA